MAVVKKTKASDLHSLCKKLVTLLKKHYQPAPISKKDRPALETMLYAVCLENATQEQADAAFQRLHESFHDLNEIRVSTFTELTPIFEGLSDPEARAARVRAILQYVFELNFDFDFESFKRKTLELAEKQLQKIRFMTNFIAYFTLQGTLGAHVIPIDDRMRDAAVWLGIALPNCTTQEAADGLRAAIHKADTVLFCQYLRTFGIDERLQPWFGKHKAPENGHDLDKMLDRTRDFLANAAKSARAAKAAARAKSKAAAKPKSSARPTSSKSASKPSAKAAAVKKKPR